MNVDAQREAIDLLQDVDGIKATTRTTLLGSDWQWMLIWSVVFLGAAVTAWVPTLVPVAGFYWLIAVPIALVLTLLVSWRAERDLPVRRRATPYWLIGLGMTVANLVVVSVLPESAIVVAVWVILGFGFGGFAWLSRQLAAAWLLAAMAALSAVAGLLASDTFRLYPILALAFGLALAGIALRIRAQADR